MLGSPRSLPRFRLLSGLVFTLLTSVGADTPTPKVDYNFEVRPILSDRCFLCHGPDERARKAGLRLDLPESALDAGVIEPGLPDESELVLRIKSTGKTQMPPKSSHLALSASEIETLRRWVQEGAEYKPHWAFLPPPRTVPLPIVSNPSWPTGTIDRFILERLDREGLKPAPEAPREDWLRRVTLDLTGLPPTPEEADAFLGDSSAKALDKVVDRLLGSNRFGERMALEWLDVARYADSFGYQADGDTNVWPWRDWVIKAFNDNLPYDQFLAWQVAGDLLPGATREQRLATAFNRLHRMTNEGGSIPEEWRNEHVSDRVQTFGTAMLGLTFECTRCHDHKYDPLTMSDYYGLGAFFNNIDEWGTYDSAGFRPSPTLPLPTSEQQSTVAGLAEKVQRAEQALRQAEDDQAPAFLQWLAREGRSAEIPGLVGAFDLDSRDADKLPNAVDPKTPGTTSAANATVPGKSGEALRFSGDDPAEFKVGQAPVDRGTPFSLAFWLKRPESLTDAIICHREAGTDTGFHGAELTLDGGKARFALVRFWPGNALAVRTVEALPADRWVHLGLSYDGSGKATGVQFTRDGQAAAVEIVRDDLTKNVQVSVPGFVFGERFRSVGLKGGLIDEIKIFDRALSRVELAHLHDGESLAEAILSDDREALRPYYLGTVDLVVAEAREALRKARQALFAAETSVNEIMTMAEMPEPRPAHILARGAYDAPKDRPVGRLTPEALPPFPKEAPRDRLGLARWLTDPDHPLTARVAVNRYWQLFFGRGIVASTENFGLQGSLPSHPALLDALARQFIEIGWDVKALCKSIVLSATYRQRSLADASLLERDPENALLARGPGQRLSAEMIRDQALFTSGLLVEDIGGPPVKPSQPPGLWKGQNAFLPEYVADKGPAAHRRGLYTFWRRTSPPPNMMAFDAPSREVCVVRRQPTNTPLQPLVLLNDPQFVEAAIALGNRVDSEGSTEKKLERAFRLVVTRRPTEKELALLLGLYKSQRDGFGRDLEKARAYLAAGPAPGSADTDLADRAAMAVIAGVILNLDAALTVR